MKIKSLIKHNLMRAAMTLALIFACATPSAVFAQQSLPYSNGFESSDPLDGWTTFNSTTIMDYWAHASSHCLGFYSSTAVTYKKIALPQFEKPINALRLEFWTRPEGYTHYLWGNFDVGYMTDLSDDNTFVAVQTYAYNDWNDISYTKKTVEFENAPDNAYIVMRHYNCNPSYYWLVDDVTVSEAPQFTVSDDGNTYTIWTAKGWGMFCDALQDNDTYNRFSGKTVKLGADISVSRMAGNDNHDFLGTFDGQHHTLTFTATATASYLAPFRNVLGNSDDDHAVIHDLNVVTNITANDQRHMSGLIALVWGYVDVTNCNVTVDISSTKGSTNTDLYPAGIASQVVRDAQIAVSGCTVDGTISTDGKYAGGIIGIVQGSATITDCLSSVTINSSTEGDGTHGGLVGLQYTYDGSTLTIEGCVFNGSLLGASTNCCGGFVGWRGKTINITNSLFAPTQVSINTTDGNVPCATFVRNGDSNTTITNSYYTEPLGTLQGTKAYSINKGENVIGVYNSTGYTYTYNTSRLYFYHTGFCHNQGLSTYKHYAVAGDEVHISINTPISCADFSTEPAGISLTLSSNGLYHFFTMPSSNVTINAEWTSSAIVSTFPWTENFNDLTDDATIPGCWNIMEIEGTFTNRWGYFTTAINGYGATNGTSYDGTNCVRYDSYNNFNGTTNYLKTVPLSLPASPEMQLSFWYKNPAGGDFSVYLSTDGGDTHTTALATGLTNQQEWTPYTISLGAYAGQEVVIVFKGTSNHNFNGDAYIYLDEVNVEDVLPCAKPTRLMATILGTQRVQLGWTKGDEDQTDWQICLDDDESNLIAAESNSYILDNLAIGSTHTVKVRANCGGNDVSHWSNEVNFTMPLQEPVSYLDMNGDTLLCIDFTVLDGSETFPLAAGWYVVEGTLNYNQTLTLSGDVHLILKDNAVMNIGTAGTPVSGNGIGNSQYPFSINIYGQSTGENNGQLNVYAAQYGIWAYEGDFNCSSAKVTVSASNYGIYALAYNYTSKGNINLKNATVTVNSTNDRAIYAQGGNLNIDGGKVSATGKNYVIYAYKQYYGGNLTISGGQVTANGGNYGLYASGGGLTLSGGQVTANGSDYGILADRGNLTISGGQVTANGSTYGLYAYGNITLGWTNASDFIYANSYYATGTLSIAEGKAFIDDEGTPHNSGTVNASDINGKTLYPYIQESVPYLDENGEQQLCTEYTVLTGTETSLAAGWYVADGTLDYDHTLTLSGDVHLILKDNTVMNVGTEETPVNGHGIYGNGHSISIYAQSMGESQGQLHLNVNADDPSQYGGIIVQNSSITINGGKVSATGYSGIFGVHAPININGGQVTVDGSGWGIYGGDNNININGGQVTANGGRYGIQAERYGIQAECGNITLGWTNASDFIYANSYFATYGTLSIADGKTFVDEDGNNYNSGTVNASDINGKTLHPYIEGSVPYIDENGEQLLCTDYTIISDNTVTTFGQNDNVERWYVVTGTVNFTSPISFMSNSNIIIAEGAVLNVGTAENPVSDHGIKTSSSADLKIYAESGTTGHVSVYSDSNSNWRAIYGDGGELVIVNCEVNASGSVGIYDTQTGINIVGCQLNLAGGNGVKSTTGPVTLKNTTLTAPSLTEKVIYSPVDLTLDSCTVVAATSATNVHAIESYGGTNGIIIKNNSNINVETTTDLLSNGIFSQMGVSIEGSTVKAKGNRGIVAGGALTITDATVKATGKSSAIWAGSSITLDGGQVTAESTSSSAICAYNGNITIRNNGKTIAESTNNYGCFAISAENGNVIIESGTVEATGIMGIYGKNVNISGGQVSATGPWYGVLAWSGNITLGWTNASDYIYANSYYADGGTLSIAEGQTFKDVGGNTYSGTVNASDINGKWLYPSVASIFTKGIEAHGTDESPSGWYLIASPLAGETNAEAVAHLVNSETPTNFDLYRFNQAAELEWENWKQQNSDHYHFNLEPGRGYLYANAANVNLVFAGTLYSGDGQVALVYSESNPNENMRGWNLVGNPFTVGATSSQPFYRMNDEGSALKTETETSAVSAMEGVFVQATGNNQTVTFTAQTRGGEKSAVAALNISLSKLIEVKVPEPVEGPTQNNGVSTSSTTLALDNAIIRFDGGQTLEKFSFREGSTKIYIPQDGTDYAIVTSEGQGEMPLNFKAETDDTYTISVNVDNVEMGYLHLIDNMTGADVDLLAVNGGDARPCVSTYTFTAKTTDYESRFKLVFAVGSSTGSDTFAFISNGNWIVSNEGHATLQVIDVNGRILSSEQINGSVSKAIHAAPGVYMLRLINGDNVKVQKIVVR